MERNYEILDKGAWIIGLSAYEVPAIIQGAEVW